MVEIIIQHADATDYILSNPEYARVLQERIEKLRILSPNFIELLLWKGNPRLTLSF